MTTATTTIDTGIKTSPTRSPRHLRGAVAAAGSAGRLHLHELPRHPWCRAIIVDTGSPANREQWLESMFGLVEPEDVRWIFLSHDDRDHAGNLLPVLAACSKATLLTTWFSIGRMAEEWMTPLQRCGS